MRRWRTLLLYIWISLLNVMGWILVAPEWPAFQEERYQLSQIVGLREFDFVVWEAEALAVKMESALVGAHRFLVAEQQQQLVLDYIDLVGESHRLQREIEHLYATGEKTAELERLENEWDTVRVEIDQIQLLAEAILQDQVGVVLAEEQFTNFGQLWPPMAARITPLPLILIISPREKIDQIYSVSLLPDLSIAEREELEQTVFERLDRAALVVPIGGVGLFPSMILETDNLSFLADVIAHEWAHHWLTLHPIGLNYAASPEMRTMNETTASIVGKEIGPEVMARFYPDWKRAEIELGGANYSLVPAQFDFYEEMGITRREVDELLAVGDIIGAEAYMEERRELFVGQGYQLRKLNQAYFAFYGAYADRGGATGTDPVGPAVRQLREESDSLRQFLDRLSGVTSFFELQHLLEQQD